MVEVTRSACSLRHRLVGVWLRKAVGCFKDCAAPTKINGAMSERKKVAAAGLALSCIGLHRESNFVQL